MEPKSTWEEKVILVWSREETILYVERRCARYEIHQMKFTGVV